MFWKKKQVAAIPVEAGTAPAPPVGVTPTTKIEAPLRGKMEKPKVEKLHEPTLIPGFVGKYLVAEYKVDTSLVSILKAVVRKSPKAEKMFDCRIFDQDEAAASKARIKDYTSLDEHRELILYEGWFDERSKRVQLEEKRKVSYDVPIFTEADIQLKIEGLQELGSTVFFYQARGPAAGGPLGRGAAIVELNPAYPRKKGKKYILYTASVVGMEPVSKGQKLMESNKPKEIAKWIKEAHHKRMY